MTFDPDRGRWLGWHVGAGSECASLVRDCIFPWIDVEARAGHLRRWFILFSDERGPHVRLRIQPGRRITADLGGSLEASLRHFAQQRSRRLELIAQDYSRRRCYFGPTVRSVYSELLNVTTSRIAMDLWHHTPDTHGHRWVATAALISAIVSELEVVCPEVDFLAAGQQFAARELGKRIAFPITAQETAAKTNRVRWLAMVLDRANATCRAHPRTQRVVALIRRMCAQCQGGQFVSVHGLHLLANKAGMSIADEYNIWSALRRVRDEAIHV